MAITVPGYHYGTVTLPRWGADVAVALEVDKRVQWFPMRHVCEVLGLEEERQVKIVKERYPHSLDTISMRLTKTSPWRPVLCIRRKEMADWVGHVDPDKCKLSARGPLREFQKELLAAADRLFWNAPATVEASAPSALVASMRAEGPISCQSCGARHWVIIENGVITAMLTEE